MRVSGRRSVHGVTSEDLVAEACSWGISRGRVHEVVRQKFIDISAATDSAAQLAGVPGEIVAFVSERLTALEAGEAAGARERTTSYSFGDGGGAPDTQPGHSALRLDELPDVLPKATFHTGANVPTNAFAAPGTIRYPRTNATDRTQCGNWLRPGSVCPAHNRRATGFAAIDDSNGRLRLLTPPPRPPPPPGRVAVGGGALQRFSMSGGPRRGALLEERSITVRQHHNERRGARHRHPLAVYDRCQKVTPMYLSAGQLVS